MVDGKRKENLTAELKTGVHTLLADVGQHEGGNDHGPNPHQLLEAALSACTIITIQMVANRKQWKLESADVTVTIDSESSDLTAMTRKVTLRGDLTEEQRAYLMTIANKCPIHKVLSGRVVISTEAIQQNKNSL